MTFNAGAARGPTAVGPPLRAVTFLWRLLGRVLTDRRQHPVQHHAQCVKLIIGQRVEKQLTNQGHVLGGSLLDGRPARGGEANHRTASVVFTELASDQASFDHSGDLMRSAAAIPPQCDTEIPGPQLTIRGLRQRHHDRIVGRRHAFLAGQLEMEGGLQLSPHISVGLPDPRFTLSEPTRPSHHDTQASRGVVAISVDRKAGSKCPSQIPPM